jgi:hypothetical protein
MTFHDTWILFAVVGVLDMAGAAIRIWAISPDARRRNMPSIGFIALIGVGLLILSLQHLLADAPRVLDHPVSSGLVILNVIVAAFAVYQLVMPLLALLRQRSSKRST